MDKKRLILIFVNVLGLCLVVFAGHYLYQAWQDHEISQYLVRRQEELAGRDTERREGKVGSTYVTSFVPKGGSGHAITSLEHQLQTYVKQELGEAAPKDQVTDYAYFRAIAQETDLKGISAYQLEWFQDHREGGRMEQGSAQSLSLLYLNRDEEVWTLADLFSDQKAAKKILSQRLEESLKEAGQSEEVRKQEVEAFEQLQLSDLAFQYKDGQLVIQLPNEFAGLSQLSLAVGQLFDVIQVDYLTDVDQAAYKQVQEVKRQEAEAAKAKEAEEKAKQAALQKAQEQPETQAVQGKVVALTFDDGPSSATTPQLLDILKQYGVKATFFVIGKNVAGNEAILQREVAEGHEVANHSWSHPNLLSLSTADAVAEINRTQEAIRVATGYTPVLFRPPYGNVNQAILNALHIPAIYWSVDSEDWKSHSGPAILQKVKEQTKPGGIILMHDIHATTVAAVPQVIEYLKSQGYQFVTVRELVGGQPQAGLIYYSQYSHGPANQ